MKKTEVFKSGHSLSTLTPALARWIEQELHFPHPEESRCGDAIVLRTRLTGVLRHLVGLVFELTIHLTPTGDGFVAVVDNGDLRKQLVALGIAWFVFWPLIVTAGYSHLTNNKILDDVLRQLRELACQE